MVKAGSGTTDTYVSHQPLNMGWVHDGHTEHAIYYETNPEIAIKNLTLPYKIPTSASQNVCETQF